MVGSQQYASQVNPPSEPRSRRATRGARWLTYVAIGLLVVHAFMLGWAATRHAPVVDEVAYLLAGLSHWKLGRFDLAAVSPPLVRSVATVPVAIANPRIDWTNYQEHPASRSAHAVGQDFLSLHGRGVIKYFVWARWACIPFSILGGTICFIWSRALYGTTAGLLSLMLWCFFPDVLAHGQMLIPDVGTAALGVTAAYFFWRWLTSPGWDTAFLGGVMLGLAQLTKGTLLVFFPLWPILWVARRWFDNAPRSIRRPQLAQLLLMFLIATYIINLGYAFQNSFTPLGKYRFLSSLLTGASSMQPTGTGSANRFDDTVLGRLPVPLPRNYVLGLDTQRYDFERGRPSFLAGDWRIGSWWYFYPVALAIKVPLGTWLLVALATLGVRQMTWRDELVLLLPAAMIALLVFSQYRVSHLRYLLPAFPFVVIWTSSIARPEMLHRRIWAALLVLALAWSVGSSVRVYPHNLAYFNELVGGPRGGAAWLNGSHLDWGQDLLALRRWLNRNPSVKLAGLAYFGALDPHLLGITAPLPPGEPVGHSLRNGAPAHYPRDLQPGWYAVSVNALHLDRFPSSHAFNGRKTVQLADFSYFRRMTPAAMAGYSIYIYHIDTELPSTNDKASF